MANINVGTKMASCNLSSFTINKQAILLDKIKKEGFNLVCVQEIHWTNNDSVKNCASFFRPCRVFHSPATANDKYAEIVTIIRGSL